MTARDTATTDAVDPATEAGSGSDETSTAASGASARTGKVTLAKASDEAATAEDTADTTDVAEADTDAAEGDAGAADTDAAEGEPTTPRAGRRRGRRHAAAEPATTGRRRRRWPLVALLVVAALFAGAMVTLYAVTRPDPIAGLSRPQQDAVTAAGQAAVNLQTFRRASFDEDFANALASLTPQFASEQLAPRKDALQKQLSEGGRDATAKALSSALVSSTATQAVVLVVTNTTQTADDGTSTPFVFSRLQLNLQLVDGKWLVSDLKSVGLS